MHVHRSRIIVFILVILAAGLVLVSACSPATPKVPTPTPTMSPTDLVKAYEEAFNKHDNSATMALVTEDVVFKRPYDGDSYINKKIVQAWHGLLFGNNAEVHFTDCTNSADIVTCKLAYIEDCTRSYGMDAYHWDASFKIVGDKISKITWDHDNPDDYKQYVETSNKAFPWFQKSHPVEYGQFMQLVNKGMSDEGVTVERGNLQAKICKEYAASIK
jgi:hypothetical protein